MSNSRMSVGTVPEVQAAENGTREAMCFSMTSIFQKMHELSQKVQGNWGLYEG